MDLNTILSLETPVEKNYLCLRQWNDVINETFVGIIGALAGLAKIHLNVYLHLLFSAEKGKIIHLKFAIFARYIVNETMHSIVTSEVLYTPCQHEFFSLV